MDNQRLILFVALAIVIMMLFSAWQKQNAPQQPVVTSEPAQTADMAVPPPVPQAEPQAVPAETPPPAAAAPKAPAGQHLKVETDLLRVEINTAGGEISRVALPAYPVSIKQPKVPYQLLDDRLPDLFIAQSGLVGDAGTSAPDHHALFQAQRDNYRLAAGSDEIKVPLRWTGDNGISVIKTYTFHRNSYVIDLDYQVVNGGGQAWKGRFYRQLQRTKVAERGQSRFIYTFMGGVVSTAKDPYQKIKFEDMATWKPEQSYDKGGWVAMIQHYFLAAWIPDADAANHFYTKALTDDRYLIGLSGPEKTIAPGQSADFHSRLFAGPKDQNRLEAVAPHLRLSVDYGMLDILAKPIFWLLEKIHGFVGNWGLAIIFVTLLIKLLFFKLSETSYRSMANMRRLSPKLQALKERYGDDRQKMSQAMMEIYKKEKINPLGGCLPIVVQIPVFISLYWVLLESVELRQAPFFLWIVDLSSKDPYYVLPLLMGASMFLQQKLNPAPMDPMQAKVLQFLPLIFTAFFAFFPSGLVLYWVVNNVLSISQQWYITRKIERQGAKA
jgi:YidC/Oxa1 family membrane protein insertase